METNSSSELAIKEHKVLTNILPESYGYQSNFEWQLYNHISPKKALFIGDVASNQFLKHKSKDKQISRKHLDKVLADKTSFLVKDKKSQKFYEYVDAKQEFDFVFTDNVHRSFSTPSKIEIDNNTDDYKLVLNEKTFYAPAGLVDVLRLLEYVNDTGVLALAMSEEALENSLWLQSDKSTVIEANLELLLNTLDYNVNAVFGFSRKNRQMGVFIITKKSSDNLFVAELDQQEVSYKTIINNFYSGGYSHDEKQNGSLNYGYFMPKDQFTTFISQQCLHKINTLKTDYKDYEYTYLDDLIINSDPTKDCSNSIFVSQNYHGDNTPLVSINNPGHDTFDVCLSDKAINEYVVIFLNSALGKAFFQSQLHRNEENSKYVLTAHNLQHMVIFVPSIDTQKQIIESHNKILNLQKSISTFGDYLSLNPNQFITETINKIDDMLDQVGKLNDADKVRSMIRGFETNAVEFKKTWRLPTKGEKGEKLEIGKKILNATVFKVINSFINANGGTLVVGVDDDTFEITGIEDELEQWFKKDTEIKKRIDRFDNNFEQQLKNAFKRDFIDLVSYRPVLIDGKYVWMVTCKPGLSPCLIQDSKLTKYLKEADFFVREGANSVPKRGQEQMDYVLSRFSNG